MLLYFYLLAVYPKVGGRVSTIRLRLLIDGKLSVGAEDAYKQAQY